MIVQRAAGVAGVDGTTKLIDYFERVYWPRKTRGRSDGTLRLYRISIANFGRYLGHDATLGDLDDEIFIAWLNWYAPRGRTNETANRDMEQLLAIWRFAARKRHVDIFPDVQKLPEVQRIPKAWTSEELKRIFAAAKLRPGKIGPFLACVWWPLLLSTAWYTGERIGALMAIECDDVDLENGWLTVPAEYRKGRAKDKAYKLPPNLCKELRAIVRKPSDKLFHWHLSEASLYDHYKALLKAAGLPTDRRSKFHRIRRSMASHLAAAGGDATAAMGHSKPETTIRHYLDPRLLAQPAPADLLFDPSA